MTKLHMLDCVQPEEVARLMAGFRQGDTQCTNRLVEIFYPELRKLAVGRIGQDHTWQPTVLVHELYLELVKIKALRGSDETGDERGSFLRFCAFLMKRILSHHERPLYRQAQKIHLDEDAPRVGPGEETLQYIDGVLAKLGAVDPRLRQVVELRVFGGMTGEEIAEELNCSRRTVATYWNFARRALEREMLFVDPA